MKHPLRLTIRTDARAIAWRLAVPGLPSVAAGFEEVWRSQSAGARAPGNSYLLSGIVLPYFNSCDYQLSYHLCFPLGMPSGLRIYPDR